MGVFVPIVTLISKVQPGGVFAVVTSDVTTIVELSDAELDMVAAGSHLSLNNLVTVNLPINIGVQLAGQANIALFSIATQGGFQSLNLTQIGLA
jgi:hypothetical protein